MGSARRALATALLLSVSRTASAKAGGAYDAVKYPDLSGCCHVYLDVGSNIGVQIRKLFEPTKYPGYKVASTFNKHFGALGSSRQKNVCALGLEANPRHAPRLAEIAAAYNARGWRTHFLAPVAASVANGKVTFYPGPVDHDSGGGGRGGNATQWWGSTVANKYNREKGSAPPVTVPRVNLADLVQRSILGRAKPAGCTSPRVVMKIDIEGGEFDVLPHMLASGEPRPHVPLSSGGTRNRGHACISAASRPPSRLHLGFLSRRCALPTERGARGGAPARQAQGDREGGARAPQLGLHSRAHLHGRAGMRLLMGP